MQAYSIMDTHYVPKCAAHFASYGRRNQVRTSNDEAEDPAYFSDEDNGSILKMWPPSQASLPQGGSSSKLPKPRWKLNDLDSTITTTTEDEESRGESATEEILAEEKELRRGCCTESEDLQSLISQFEGQSFRPDPLCGSNILMKKCGQKVKLSDPNWRRKQTEILALSKVMAGSQPQLLTSRNFEVNEQMFNFGRYL